MKLNYLILIIDIIREQLKIIHIINLNRRIKLKKILFDKSNQYNDTFYFVYLNFVCFV